MYCSASATLWIRCSCWIEVMGCAFGAGADPRADGAWRVSLRRRQPSRNRRFYHRDLLAPRALARARAFGRLAPKGRLARGSRPSATTLPSEEIAMSTIQSGMQEKRVFEPSEAFMAQANVKKADWEAMNAKAARDFEGFWADLAREHLAWRKPFTKALDESRAPYYEWFADGELNVSYNCLDRNLENGNADKVAIVFEADDGKVTNVTYRDLHQRGCALANGLKSLGVKKGDRVVIYMPMSIEGVAAMQACARIG